MRKILIIRFSSIGDIVLTSPVLRCLKKQLGHLELHYLTKKSFVNVIQHNPFIDKIHAIDTHIAEVIQVLQTENFDHIIDLHHNLRSAEVKIKLLKSASSLDKLNIKKWLLVKMKMNRLPALHIVDRYMETVRHLGVVNDQEGLDYFIPLKDEVDVSALPLGYQNGYIGFVIGAKHVTKRLPTEKIISICKELNLPVILLGGKEDEERGSMIETALNGRAYNACGKYNLNQSASLVKQARVIITHDTGLMHIAAALKKEIISIWGNTVPAFGMYPYLPGTSSKVVEVNGLSCRPCSKLGYESCPKGHFNCMQLINEKKIVALANGIS